VGVTGYKIYCGGTYLKSVTRTTTSHTGLTASTQYCYKVSAADAAGNESAQGTQACATTQSAGPTTVALGAARDASIVWSDIDPNFANATHGSTSDLDIGNYYLWGYPFSSYMKQGALVDFSFDPATWLGRTVISAKLRLYVKSYAVQRTGRYVAYKIVDTVIGGSYRYPWTEAGVTWNNAPNYELSPTSTAYPPANPADYTEWDVTSIVQGWFTSGTMGNGILILDMNPPPSINYTTDQTTTYCSREYSAAAYRPQLIITY
jgi:hypothetical protein